jgi:predicted RNA-binding protein with PIN domain
VPRLIDGDNLLGTWPGRGRTDDDKRTLVREVDALKRRERKRIVIVFDGTAPAGVSHGPDVLYSGRGASADSRILALLRTERDPKGWTVVTNDRQLADRCRHLGARIERPRPFRERLAAGDPGEKPDAAGDVDYWLGKFGGDDPQGRR